MGSNVDPCRLGPHGRCYGTFSPAQVWQPASHEGPGSGGAGVADGVQAHRISTDPVASTHPISSRWSVPPRHSRTACAGQLVERRDELEGGDQQVGCHADPQVVTFLQGSRPVPGAAGPRRADRLDRARPQPRRLGRAIACHGDPGGRRDGIASCASPGVPGRDCERRWTYRRATLVRRVCGGLPIPPHTLEFRQVWPLTTRTRCRRWPEHRARRLGRESVAVPLEDRFRAPAP